MKIVIRAGGIGTRLWPMSRERNPKQFQVIISNKTLLQDTAERIKPLLKDKGDLFISANEALKERVIELIPDFPLNNIILETASKNTGPAICLESVVLADRFSTEATIASLPSDDFISDAQAFRELLEMTENFLESHPDYIITPGIKPTYPDTGYSYIKTGKNLHAQGEEAVFTVTDWVEKPELDYCKEIIASGLYYYHTGMYIWKLKTVLGLFKKYQPNILRVCQEIVALGNKGGQLERIRDLYAGLEKISIEAAITDKVDKIAMSVSNRIGWSDLGKWHIIKDLLPPNNGDNLTRGNVFPFDTTDCLIYGPKDKLIATIGLDDLIIVDTENALFVCPKERSDEVKKIVEELKKKKGYKKYL